MSPVTINEPKTRHYTAGILNNILTFQSVQTDMQVANPQSSICWICAPVKPLEWIQYIWLRLKKEKLGDTFKKVLIVRPP